jgi:tetratricopeptide (TPR) repeat protein
MSGVLRSMPLWLMADRFRVMDTSDPRSAAVLSTPANMAPLVLPPAPAAEAHHAVKAWQEGVSIPTYLPDAPDRHPLFLEQRVYQGSSGRVYPLPVVDRIAETPVERRWDAIHLENEHVRLMILPELGGRIHIGLDKGNGYDFFYRQNVIKPALVGLAGPWCSGGVEFNWPQHHRPATAMPVAVAMAMEREADGAVTVWCSDHDPLARMKGMHGVRLRPGSAAVEVRVRLHNRTNEPQTFLWWANVATRVHDQYQSFFPPEVGFVADHARRATTTFPLATGTYYGVDYGARAGHVAKDGVAANDLTWYRNIPVPTSYMITGTKADFFGGYDHAVGAGLVHVADHRFAPGKKQWTWGDHPFGHAWDRHLTDGDGPYIELMAGVFTDNQPDFSHLAPGETRSFEQMWYPIKGIGPAQAANRQVALHLSRHGKTAKVGVAVVMACALEVVLSRRGAVLARWQRDLDPNQPLVETVALPARTVDADLRLEVREKGDLVLAWSPQIAVAEPPVAATQPPAPEGIASVEELVLTGQHLAQYRHATRSPVPYWQEALQRDEGHSGAHLALGWWHRRRGELLEAKRHFTAAIARLTVRNGNPADGEAFYGLGLVLIRLGDDDGAWEALGKACWNRAWQGPARLALGEIACRRGHFAQAALELHASVAAEAQLQRARALLVIVLRRLGRADEAAIILAESRRRDALDWWAADLAGAAVTSDPQVRLDLAFDHLRAGLWEDALRLLAGAACVAGDGAEPVVRYLEAWCCERLGRASECQQRLVAARAASPDRCFPARSEEESLLRWALARDPADARANHYLGNWLYDRRRHQEAIVCWRAAAAADPQHSVTWRNLGLGAWNVLGRGAEARRCYERAVETAPEAMRLWYERDQLWRRLGVAPARRLRALATVRERLGQRDDLAVAYGDLLCQVGRPGEALSFINRRRFQPWEGGEGLVLAVHKRAHLALARQALQAGRAAEAEHHARAALSAPEHLGEAWHLLQNQSDAWFILAEACAALGKVAEAQAWWQKAADFSGDFQAMGVRPYSVQTLWSARACHRLGRTEDAKRLLAGLAAHARKLGQSEARIDYFATSLPTLLLFTDDLQQRQNQDAAVLAAHAAAGQGRRTAARRQLATVLQADPAHAAAADLLADLASGWPAAADVTAAAPRAERARS